MIAPTIFEQTPTDEFLKQFKRSWFLFYIVLPLLFLVFLCWLLNSFISVFAFFFTIALFFILLIPQIVGWYTFVYKLLKNKIHPNEKIQLSASGITIINDSKINIPFNSILGIKILSYSQRNTFDFVGNPINELGVYKLITNLGDFFIPPTYINRESLLKVILKGANLQKRNPTIKTSIPDYFVIFNRGQGHFSYWEKSTTQITEKDLNLYPYSSSSKFVMIFGLSALLFIIIITAWLIINPKGFNNFTQFLRYP